MNPARRRSTPSLPALLIALVTVAALLLAGCAPISLSGGQSRGGGGSGKPYTVRGKTYRPYTTANGFTEVGVASWYGPGFHGKKTANGERYGVVLSLIHISEPTRRS